MHRHLIQFLCFAAVIAAAPAAFAQSQLERAAFERKVEAELRERDPGSIELLERAEAARMADQLDSARAQYRELLDRVPGFVHAQRRLCTVEARLGNVQEALQLCRQALAASAIPENQIALAGVLIEASRDPDDLDEAERLIQAALRQDSYSVHALIAQCQLAIATDHLELLSRCSERIREQAPDEMTGWLFSAIAAASHEDWSDARRYLERARELGLPAEAYRGVLDAIEDAEPIWPAILTLAGIAVAIWLALLLVLVIAGAVLSRRTARAAEAITGADACEPVHPLGASLRSTYEKVLQASCVFYYLSIPLLLGIVVLTGGGLIYGFWVAGYVPIKLVFIIGVVTVLTVVAILKSLWVRGRDLDPGLQLDWDDHPELRVILDEVAAKVGTRPVDHVYLTPGADIAVLERGGVITQLRGSSERCLILGLAGLDGMRLPAFKAILAHEYGHFSNRDTAGGGLALAVRRSLLTMGLRLAESGSAAWYNPAWLFFHGFYRVFLRISHGASRLQEILADRWAVLCYGASSFEAGLRHAIAAGLRFDAHTGRVVDHVIDTETPLDNLYRHPVAEPVTGDELDEAIAAAIDAAPSAYDSHPRPADRIRWAHAMNADEPATEPTTRDASSLLCKRQELEELMTREVRSQLREHHGLVLP